MPGICSTAPTVSNVEGGTYVSLYPVSGAASYNVGFENTSGVVVYQVPNIGPVITQSGYQCTGVPPGSYYIVAQTNCTNGATSAWGSPYFGGLQTVNSVKANTDSARMSAIVAGQTIGLLAYPNPTHSQVNLIYNSPGGGQADIMIASAFGNTVYRKLVNTAAGQNYYTLDIGELASGVYVLKITDGKTMHYQKLLITK